VAGNAGVSESAGASTYRREGGDWLIELRLRELRQLFHHLDPAPFREKDLDPSVEAYIVDAVRELGLARPKRLVIHLPPAERLSEDAGSLPLAVANYFGYRAWQSRVELGRLLRRALVNLAIGLAFLFACLSLRGSLTLAASNSVFAEGLLIIGWVALWRPVEMFLYDWWPLMRERRRFEAIASMRVEIR
jgi:hypothetical protein